MYKMIPPKGVHHASITVNGNFYESLDGGAVEARDLADWRSLSQAG